MDNRDYFEVPLRVMVLGGASWLGNRLLQVLSERGGYALSASYHRQRLEQDESVNMFQAKIAGDYSTQVDAIKPEVIVNFLRGEDDNGLAIHNDLIHYCKKRVAHYIYASSALALDAYQDVPLVEELKGESISPYGQFKAKCEHLLYGEDFPWTILRFASVQGWAPHKPTRNEAFLQKMEKNAPVKVETGIRQNRMSADLLIDGIVEVIARKMKGVLHFGTTDASEEHDYLARVARAFGYSADLVKAEGERKVNLVTLPGRILNELPDKFRVTEEDTLKTLLNIPALQAYLRAE